MPLAAAVAGAAIIGGIATVAAGNKAAKATTHAADQQVAEQRRQYDQDRTDLAPWRETGASALSKLAGMYGVGSGTTATAGAEGSTGTDQAYGGFFTSPGFRFRMDEGNKAVQRSAAARGILGSGATIKAIDRFSQGLASSEYDAFSSRLAQIAGFGQNATNATVAAGENATAGIAGAYGRAGDARASSYLNTGSAINSTLNNMAAAYAYGGMKTPSKLPNVYGM